MRFEWDPLKELSNIRKHNVSFRDATQAFDDIDGLDIKDEKHSLHEIRWHWVGKISDGRIITVRYTMRGDVIRIFGAAEWREYRKVYYEETEYKKS